MVEGFGTFRNTLVAGKQFTDGAQFLLPRDGVGNQLRHHRVVERVVEQGRGSWVVAARAPVFRRRRSRPSALALAAAVVTALALASASAAGCAGGLMSSSAVTAAAAACVAGRECIVVVIVIG